MSSSHAELKKDRSDIRSFLIQLVITIAAVWAVLTFVFGIAVVKGEGMYPRIRDGDLAFYYRLNKTPSIGEVVTLQKDGTRYFGRVVAQEGDTVDISEEGELIVNGNVQSEEIFYPTYQAAGSVSYPLTLNTGEYFLLGDFRTNTIDSRSYGPVNQKDLNGTVISILRRRGI